MVTLGIILLLIGIFAHIGVLLTIGIILAVVGACLILAGALGSGVAGRRHYY
jgi:hypothetical protein